MATDAKVSAKEITADLRERLRARYSSDGCVFASEVQNGTGMSSYQIADAIAMEIWPSRGYTIHGFEIKASRADWLKELKTPAKADDIASQCDHWWIVAPKEIIKDGELPNGWGLLSPSGDGLKIVVRSERREALPINRGFVAAFLRRISQKSEGEYLDRVRADKERWYKNGFEAGEKSVIRKERRDARDDAQEKLISLINRFTEKTGRPFNEYTINKISDQFKRYADADDFLNSQHFRRLSELKSRLGDVSEALDALLVSTTESDQRNAGG